MTELAVFFSVALLIALLYERRQNAVERATREEAWRHERTLLLNRIQAPEASPFLEDNGEAQFVGFDDDDALREVQS